MALLVAALAGCTAYQPLSWDNRQGRDSGKNGSDSVSMSAYDMHRRASPRVSSIVQRPIPPSRRHVVMPGDTLSEISVIYSVPISRLASLNKTAPPHTIYVGQEILLARPPAAPDHYRIAAGDTFLGIAFRYGLTLDELRSRNPTVDPEAILVGQTLAVATTIAPKPHKRPHIAANVRSQIASAATVPERSQAGFGWPVEGDVVDRFGERSNGSRHDGINIKAALGSTVRASEGGIVVYAGQSVPGMGRMIMIRHADGYFTAYGHNDMVLVETGQRVDRGQPIAKVGQSGAVGSPQLHFEIRRGSDAIDPLDHLGKPTTTIASNR